MTDCVVRVANFFPYGSKDFSSVPKARDSDREIFSLTFALDKDRTGLVISNANTISLIPQSIEQHVSEPIIISSPTGDLDGISPP